MSAISFDAAAGYGVWTSAAATGLDATQSKKSLDALKEQLGDTVSISDEGRALLAAKLQEYQGKDPAQLSDAEKQDLRDTVQEALGLSDEQMAALDEAAAAGRQAPPAEAGQQAAAGSTAAADQAGATAVAGQAGAGGAAAGGGGAAGSGSSDSESQIDDLEEQIQALEKEIEELQSKSQTDEEAKQQLAAKQVELASLQAELAQLETQSAQA